MKALNSVFAILLITLMSSDLLAQRRGDRNERVEVTIDINRLLDGRDQVDIFDYADRGERREIRVRDVRRIKLDYTYVPSSFGSIFPRRDARIHLIVNGRRIATTSVRVSRRLVGTANFRVNRLDIDPRDRVVVEVDNARIFLKRADFITTNVRRRY